MIVTCSDFPAFSPSLIPPQSSQTALRRNRMRFLMSTFDEVKEDVYCQHIHLVVESFFIKSFSRREIHHLALDTFLSSLSIGTSWSKSISNRSSSEGDTLFSKCYPLQSILLSSPGLLLRK